MFDLIKNTDLKSLKEQNRASLENMSKSVYGVPAEQLTPEQIKEVIYLDLGTNVTKMTISASSTRRTEVQFCTNNYIAALDIDCSDIKESILFILKSTPDDQVLDKYIELKTITYRLLTSKYESNENYLRKLLRSAEEKDNVVGVGRFA